MYVGGAVGAPCPRRPGNSYTIMSPCFNSHSKWKICLVAFHSRTKNIDRGRSEETVKVFERGTTETVAPEYSETTENRNVDIKCDTKSKYLFALITQKYVNVLKHAYVIDI
jgi:hypothetical protein